LKRMLTGFRRTSIVTRIINIRRESEIETITMQTVTPPPITIGTPPRTTIMISTITMIPTPPPIITIVIETILLTTPTPQITIEGVPPLIGTIGIILPLVTIITAERRDPMRRGLVGEIAKNMIRRNMMTTKSCLRKKKMRCFSRHLIVSLYCHLPSRYSSNSNNNRLRYMRRLRRWLPLFLKSF